ncbi:MAG: hypothetical protein K1X38_09480 [Microthrixaceae bacterium]|nr:hypothetical protein [Microthrixaceae bacterium]
MTARKVALDALVEIEATNAYANLKLGPLLERSGLDERDRRLVTELVYGTIRRQRSVDYLVDRFLVDSPPPAARAALRLGAYQLRLTDIPDHAAVAATVDVTPKRFRGLVNAVLRKVAKSAVEWPDDGTRLSYPDWIVDRLCTDLGDEAAIDALETMNRAPEVTVRDDGYTQDRSSQRVVEALGVRPGQLVVDVCAAPGGKATAMATFGARVVAADFRPRRVGLIASNAQRVAAGRASDASVWPVVADARRPPFRSACADVVLVDAPCSGLGVLRRRPDARWRVSERDVAELAEMQGAILASSSDLVADGALLAYSVCTLTAAETTGVAEAFAAEHPEFEPVAPPGDPWQRWGTGALLLPQADDSDGMALFLWRRRP